MVRDESPRDSNEGELDELAVRQKQLDEIITTLKDELSLKEIELTQKTIEANQSPEVTEAIVQDLKKIKENIERAQKEKEELIIKISNIAMRQTDIYKFPPHQ